VDKHHLQPVQGSNGPGRRRFLALAGAAGVGAAVAAPSLDALANTRAAWHHRPDSGPTTADWEALRHHLSTRHLVRPGQRGYNQAKQLFDPQFDRLRPTGVAYCATPADVAACVTFAARFKLPIRARSGGHSYAGWSSVNGGLVVDVTGLNSYGVGNGTVKVGTGLGLIDFYSRLARRGLAVPGGSCPTVGIAGLTLGGGVGVLGRNYGLTCDNLEAVQIVTANGDILNCDSHTNSDLLWASQGGGGGNFGIATSFTFRSHRLSSLALFFLSWPWSQARRVVDGWQRWAPHAPNALWSNLHLSAAPGGTVPSVGVGGTYVGSVGGAAAQLDKLYALIGSRPSSSFLGENSYLQAMLVEAGCSGLTVPQCHTGMGGHLGRVPFFAKSDFFTHRLGPAGLTALLNGIERFQGVAAAGGASGSIAFDAFGGAINAVHPDATAFVHRNTLFLAQYYTQWRSPGSARGIANQHQWIRQYHDALRPHASGQAYQNYIDPDLTNWRQAYYGANYARLSQIKGKYDPHQLFSFPQAITPPA
jgi:FAD/FMN-containing dehydrogenase